MRRFADARSGSTFANRARHGRGGLPEYLAATSFAMMVLQPAVAAADAPPGGGSSPIVVLDDWGTYAGSSTKDEANPGSNSGKLSKVFGAESIQQTHSICAELGTMFGIKIRLEDDLPYQQLPVAIEIDHPAMVNIHGQKQDRDIFDTILHKRPAGWRGWIFHDRNKLIPGKWTFIVSHSKAVLLTETFDVSFGCSKPIA